VSRSADRLRDADQYLIGISLCPARRLRVDGSAFAATPPASVSLNFNEGNAISCQLDEIIPFAR